MISILAFSSLSSTTGVYFFYYSDTCTCMLRVFRTYPILNITKKFNMKYMEKASYALTIKLLRNRKQKTLGLSQASYVDKVLSKFSMDHCKGSLIPFRHGLTLFSRICPSTQEERRGWAWFLVNLQYEVLRIPCFVHNMIFALLLVWLTDISQTLRKRISKLLNIF